MFQERVVSRSDTGESVQFQRQQKLRLAVAVAVRYRASRDGAQLVTTGLVFEAGELIERLRIEQAIDISPVHVQALADRPGDGGIDLLDAIVQCAIREVQFDKEPLKTRARARGKALAIRW